MEISNGATNKTLKTACCTDMYDYYKGATNLTLNFLGTNPERKSWLSLQVTYSVEDKLWTIELYKI